MSPVLVLPRWAPVTVGLPLFCHSCAPRLPETPSILVGKTGTTVGSN